FLRYFIVFVRCFFFLLIPPPLRSTLFPYTTLFRSRFRSRWNRMFPGLGGSRRIKLEVKHSGKWRSIYFGRRRLLRSSDSFVRRRSEEHTSELQSRGHLVCRLLLEKKKK